MNWLQGIIMGIVQGLTEFLPISSDGHLKLVQKWMGLKLSNDALLLFDTLVHVGTLLAVIAVFAPDLWRIIKAFLTGFAKPAQLAQSYTKGKNRPLALLIVATLPAVIAGVLLKDKIEGLLPDKWLGLGFIMTAAFLLMGDFFARKSQEKTDDLGKIPFWTALVMGIGQAAALLKGVSRSGMTISTARMMGTDRNLAARFSMLMSVIAILGAVVLQGKELLNIGETGLEILPVALGMIAAAVSGIMAIRILFKALQKGKFWVFAVYTALLGLLILAGVL